MVSEKVVEIEWNGQKEKVVLKRLTWGEMNKLMAEVIGKLKVKGGDLPELDIDIVKWRELLLLYSIKSAPFSVDIESIRNLPAEIGEKLYREAEELNPFFPV